MSGTILQVSISRGGIPKRAIDQAEVTSAGIRGDSWAHPRLHGGPKQALLLMCMEAMQELKHSGYPLFAGALGENLTVAGLDRTQMRLGQQFKVGDVVLELTKIRVPCNTLNVYGASIKAAVYDKRVKAGDFTSPRWGLSGFYASVQNPGIIRPGDIISVADQVV